jgi:glycolate oxidase FAD binding subunit
MSTSSITGTLPWSELETIASTRAASAEDAVDGLLPSRVALPETVDEVIAILAWANANGARVVARGGGTKLTWGNAPQALDIVLSLEKLQRIVDHAWQDMTVTVQAGVTIAALQSELAKHGQRVPLDGLWPERSTVGGVVATNESGALRLRYGSVRDLLLGVTVVLANGTVARSGGRVVKNVAGYDLPKLFTGSFGTLGVITEVTLRTYPLPHAARELSFRFGDSTAANRMMLAVSDSTLVPSGMQLRVGDGELPTIDLRFEGLEEGIAAQVERAMQLANAAEQVQTPAESFQREALFADPDAIVAKFSVLPTRIAEVIHGVRSHCESFQIIVQSLGLGMFAASVHDVAALRKAVQEIGGTVVILQAPPELKRQMDVFGPLPSAYPLMVRVKQQFDPKGILSPGRFVGGI